ncbi:MAG: thiolase domain-containing protein [Microthrixaceae bacterium]|nr:thiolase domain-containing protein [Microthrixaceae bacterium]
MGKERVAVVGIGQTKHQATRGDVSMAGLLREAAQRALTDAQMTWTDIDAVVIGKAPDFFEGVMMPELFLADALGCTGKPLFRVHTAGSVGGSTAIVASQLISAGIHERVLTVAFEKQSESEAMWALSLPIPFTPPLHAGAGGYFAPHVRSYIRRAKAPDHTGILVALKDRQNGLKNPYAHLHEPDITFDSIKDSLMLWDPIRYAETCPSSDGACALVLGSEKVADDAAAEGRKPAWIQGTAMRSEPTLSAERDTVLPLGGALCAADVYRQAGITNPRKDVDCVEMYVPFSWFEPMWLENLGFAEPGEGWKLTEEGVTALDGDLPVNMSGGVLCTNPIGASGMLRFAEAAMQVRGTAGDHQVDGARKAVGHAYGGGSQFFAMWVVGRDKVGPPPPAGLRAGPPGLNPSGPTRACCPLRG